MWGELLIGIASFASSDRCSLPSLHTFIENLPNLCLGIGCAVGSLERVGKLAVDTPFSQLFLGRPLHPV